MLAPLQSRETVARWGVRPSGGAGRARRIEGDSSANEEQIATSRDGKGADGRWRTLPLSSAGGLVRGITAGIRPMGEVPGAQEGLGSNVK